MALLTAPSQLNYPPKRIISLVPSQTELLFELGLDEMLAGVTKFCVHPPEAKKNKPIIGGTKNIHVEKIITLNPDLVIANKEENVKEQVEALAGECNVYVTDINNAEDAFKMINDIGLLTLTSSKANPIVNKIKDAFSAILPMNSIPTAYLIWRNPYMTIGGDTFIHDMLARCGLQNIYSSQTRYPEADIEYLKQQECKLLLLSSEPYPFKQKHLQELQQQLPGTRIELVDGEMFSWYGSRLMHAPAYFNLLLQKLSQTFA
jgi:ABC-type Fe3+-hydroxamate transport system substrate-binding protein